MDDFRVSIALRHPFAIIAVAGELDIATIDQFRTQVEALLAQEIPRLVFDLSRLRFIDSGGMQVIFEAYHHLGRGDHVSVCGLTPIVRKVFDVLGLAGQIAIYPTCEDALSHPVQG
ncbi:STAS domain-containing protein [Planotetraspora sp. A-T 1434]|uniref:STAS domain-containing protein n=1 Tax=Planotetraspora sp. A-T 1434 TaxID=2979219 RepID=UPI0021BF8988|nr:STAS domain-containing protein [Planotetraspora sp. A-T 1434]MCT9934625.1 STAS domain-containing protein [Planotetraspora sp. A-T 1434]